MEPEHRQQLLPRPPPLRKPQLKLCACRAYPPGPWCVALVAEKNKSRILSEGGVGCIVEAMKNHPFTAPVQEYALGILWNLALHGTCGWCPSSCVDASRS